MATKKSDSLPVAPNVPPVGSKIRPVPCFEVFEAALQVIADGNALDKNDYSIQIARTALGLD